MTEDSQAGFSTLSDLEEAASKKTDKSAWAYIQGGAGEEWTMKANREAFHRRLLTSSSVAGLSLSLDAESCLADPP